LGGSYGSAPTMGQNPSTGNFFVGNSGCSGCNYVNYLNGVRGGYAIGTSITTSRIPLQSGGTSLGLAVSNLNNMLYVTDSINDVVTFLSPSTLFYGIRGSSVNSIFAAPLGLSPQYVAVSGTTVLVTDNVVGSVFFLNGVNGSFISPVGSNPYLPLVSGSTGCNSASLVSLVQTNVTGNIGYVLCGGTVVVLNLNGNPNYMNGNLVGSTFGASGITVGTDLVYDSTDNVIVVVGGSTVTSLLSPGGAVAHTVDLTTYGCGTGITINSVAYSAARNQIYVADSANSTIYILNSSNLTLSTGLCTTSTFSTFMDVPTPTRMSFF